MFWGDWFWGRFADRIDPLAEGFPGSNSALLPPSRMTHQSGMNVFPNTGFMRKVANWPDEGVLHIRPKAWPNSSASSRDSHA